MKTHLRASAMLTAALLLAALLTACGGPAAGPGQAPLTLMGKKSDLAKSYMQRIFARYEEKTGQALEIIAIEDNDFEVEAAKRFAAGDGPDILMHFHNADLARYDEADFVDLSGQPWVEDLTASARAYCQNAEGELLGLPFWENSVSGCYYNKTVFDSLGLKPATTQAEFDALCQVLADTGYTPICWPANGCAWMMQFALDPVFADDPALLEALNRNEITYEKIPAVTDMVQWIADAAEKGWFGQSYLADGWDEISPAMGSGAAVMTFIWDTWFYTDLSAGQTYAKEDFALMPVFLGTAEEGTYEGGNLNMMMVNKNGAHADKALEFLAFCAEAENYNAAFDGIATVNCFKGQTTNLQSQMVTDAAASIAERERVSTAASKIVGYNAEDVGNAIAALLDGRTDVAGCVRLMDEYRIAEAKAQGMPGF